MSTKHKITVIGAWHQGVVGAACLAEMGHHVLAADHDAERIAKLSTGASPIYEPGLNELLAAQLKASSLSFTNDVGSSVKGKTDVLLMFDTPVDENDQSDLSIIWQTIDEISPQLEQDVLILVTAQVPAGTCSEIEHRIRERRGDLSFHLAYIPENLRLGQAIERFKHPALPAVGADSDEAHERVMQLYAGMDVEWKRMNVRSAEMTKHALNAYLALSICFANELGNICDELGADGVAIAQALRLEERVGKKAMLYPGLGFSGGTLARDMQSLRGFGDKFGIDTKLLDGAWAANQSQNELVVRKLTKAFGSLKGLKLAVWGLTYKPDTSTLRRSASIEIIQDLHQGGAQVRAHDPKADREELKQYKEFEFDEDPYGAVENAQALVLITGWSDYKEVDFKRVKDAMAADAVLIDTQNMLDGDSLTSLGFTYLNIGRGRTIGS